MNPESIYGEIIKSKKSAALSEDTLRRLCRGESRKYKKDKDALKAVKNRIYTMHGAFFPENCNQKARSILEEASGFSCDDTGLKELCSRILSLHVSTQERLPYLNDFYEYIFDHMPAAGSIMDIGCGFNPFALPWMHGLSGQGPVTYYAADIDVHTVELINLFFSGLGMAETALVMDVILGFPEQSADIVFLFKLAPLLEQQQKGKTFELLKHLDTKRIVVTFPIKSLSGRNKGMTAYYGNFFEKNLSNESLSDSISIMHRKVIGNELVYILAKESS